jgi:transposase
MAFKFGQPRGPRQEDAMRVPLEIEKQMEQEKIDAHVVNHLPIIRAYADRIGLVPIINHLVPSKMEIDPGTIFLGMVLDTLSGRSPLYRLDTFFESQDTELLLGKKVAASSFSDHNIARAMDKAYDVGTLKIYSSIATNAISVFGVEAKHVNFDTTSVSVQGDYDLYDTENHGHPFKITYGHSKDHRPDLKQFMISLLCVDRTVPIFGRTEDGNSSDKSINNTILSNISKYMANHGVEPGAFIYIADSAMVTAKNLSTIGDRTLFISRLPATFKECSSAITTAIENDQWEDLGVLSSTSPTKNRPATHYKAYETSILIDGRHYRAIVIHSSAHDKRRQKRIERQLETERKALVKQCQAAAKIDYYCEADARAAARALNDLNVKYYRAEIEIEESPRYKRGRPKNGGAEIREIRYRLCWNVSEKTQAISKLKKEAGCFVLIANVPSDGENGYNSQAILRAYKDQYGIEQNFGFLKDPVIVNSVFLKKPERIEVLGLVLLISLLIWRLIERSMRQFVEKGDRDLPGWERRRTTRPTTFMLMTKFQGVMIVKIGSERRLNKPLKPQQLEYLSALGVKPEAFTLPRARAD